jgi:hypothetical protein
MSEYFIFRLPSILFIVVSFEKSRALPEMDKLPAIVSQLGYKVTKLSISVCWDKTMSPEGH